MLQIKWGETTGLLLPDAVNLGFKRFENSNMLNAEYTFISDKVPDKPKMDLGGMQQQQHHQQQPQHEAMQQQHHQL